MSWLSWLWRRGQGGRHRPGRASQMSVNALRGPETAEARVARAASEDGLRRVRHAVAQADVVIGRAVEQHRRNHIGDMVADAMGIPR